MRAMGLLLMMAIGWIGKSIYEVKVIRTSLSEGVSMSWGKRLQREAITGYLGGLRSVIADIAWLRVTWAWEGHHWTRLQENIWIATRMEPESLLFWDVGAWHLAWNAAYSEKNNILESHLERRIAREHFWIEQGRALLEEGTLYHPHHFKLWLQLGMLHQERRKDYQAAYHCYLRASEQEGAPSYAARLAGYALEKTGDFEGAKVYWKSLLMRTTRVGDRAMIEKRLLKLEKDSSIFPRLSLP